MSIGNETPEARSRRPDPEVQRLAALVDVLDPMTSEERARAFRYLADRYKEA